MDQKTFTRHYCVNIAVATVLQEIFGDAVFIRHRHDGDKFPTVVLSGSDQEMIIIYRVMVQLENFVPES